MTNDLIQMKVWKQKKIICREEMIKAFWNLHLYANGSTANWVLCSALKNVKIRCNIRVNASVDQTVFWLIVRS